VYLKINHLQASQSTIKNYNALLAILFSMVDIDQLFSIMAIRPNSHHCCVNF